MPLATGGLQVSKVDSNFKTLSRQSTLGRVQEPLEVGELF